MDKLRRWIARLFRSTPLRAIAPPPPPPPRMFVTHDVLDATSRLVSSYRGPDGQHEGIVYWAGVPAGRDMVVTTVVAPEAITSRGSYRTSAVANALVVAKVASLRLQVLAQVHGHPGSWVGHSDGDNAGAFMPYTGFYSIVVPNYGQDGLVPLTTCGVHRFDGQQFEELDQDAIEQSFVEVPRAVDLRRNYVVQPLGRGVLPAPG